MNALKFHDATLTVTDLYGQAWLRGSQIGTALGYATPDLRIRNLYNRHAAEFTAEMTALVNLPTPGGMQETRIFSLRGARMLAMHARTARAAEFRAWVLDLIEGASGTSADDAALSARRAAEIIRLHPRFHRLQVLVGVGLLRREMAAALGVSTTTLRSDLNRMSALGLIAPQALATHGPRRNPAQIEMFAHV